jgi:hypothetical protein
LKLPEEVQNALREGLIGVSQGYIFAANLGPAVADGDLPEGNRGGVHECWSGEGVETGDRECKRTAGPFMLLHVPDVTGAP